MGKRTFHVSILPHWGASDDVLLKALVDSGESALAHPWPFDGLLLRGRRDDDSPLIVEAIELPR